MQVIKPQALLKHSSQVPEALSRQGPQLIKEVQEIQTLGAQVKDQALTNQEALQKVQLLLGVLVSRELGQAKQGQDNLDLVNREAVLGAPPVSLQTALILERRALKALDLVKGKDQPLQIHQAQPRLSNPQMLRRRRTRP